MVPANSYNCAAKFSQMPFAVAMLGELFAHGDEETSMSQPDLEMDSYIHRVLNAFRDLDDGLELRTPQLAQLRRHIESQQSGKPTVEVEDELTETESPILMPRRSVGPIL